MLRFYLLNCDLNSFKRRLLRLRLFLSLLCFYRIGGGKFPKDPGWPKSTLHHWLTVILMVLVWWLFAFIWSLPFNTSNVHQMPGKFGFALVFANAHRICECFKHGTHVLWCCDTNSRAPAHYRCAIFSTRLTTVF